MERTEDRLEAGTIGKVVSSRILGSLGVVLNPLGKPADFEAAASFHIDFKNRATQSHRALGHGEPGGHPGTEPPDHGFDGPPQHGFFGAAHPGIGQVAGSARENRVVSRLDMGVGPKDGGHLSIEHPSHRDFLAGRFRMVVHHNRADALGTKPFGLCVCGKVRILKRRLDKRATLHLHHGDPALCRLQHHASVPRSARRIVEGAEQSRLGREVIDDFRLIPNVVARRDDRHPGSQEVNCNLGGDPLASGGVLAIDNHEIELFRLPQLGQLLDHGFATGLSDNVAQKENSNGRHEKTAGWFDIPRKESTFPRLQTNQFPMSPNLQRSVPLIVILGLAALALILRSRQPAPQTSPIPPPANPTPSLPAAAAALSALGETPDWSALNVYQNTISREEFERLLTTVFVTGGAWRRFIELTDNAAIIATGSGPDATPFHLHFAPPDLEEQAPRGWRTTQELPAAAANKPLDGLNIAIDPGHLGGEWAKLEERWLQVGSHPPVCEGDLTLQVAQLLKPRLEALGAFVSLVRDKSEPLTPLRPESLISDARSTLSGESPEDLQKLAERLFYRTAEIRARAKHVNQTLKPDLVLCLHFNADPWGDPANPKLVERSHLHLLLNGAYTDEEVGLADQRFALLKKLLSRTHAEEASIGASVADAFAGKSGLPPFLYPPGAPNALLVNGNPYLWARNLLANRLYDCPVIFMEPYVMNSTLDLPRIQAGDYEGLRDIQGRMVPSIFREYVDGLVEGLRIHYESHRPR